MEKLDATLDVQDECQFSHIFRTSHNPDMLSTEIIIVSKALLIITIYFVI